MLLGEDFIYFGNCFNVLSQPIGNSHITLKTKLFLVGEGGNIFCYHISYY